MTNATKTSGWTVHPSDPSHLHVSGSFHTLTHMLPQVTLARRADHSFISSVDTLDISFGRWEDPGESRQTLAVDVHWQATSLTMEVSSPSSIFYEIPQTLQVLEGKAVSLADAAQVPWNLTSLQSSVNAACFYHFTLGVASGSLTFPTFANP